MTMTPRDPRLRRQHTDPLAAAVRLSMSADAMRAQQHERGPEPARVFFEDESTVLTPQLAAAVQGATHEPRITAQEFADALAADVAAAEADEPHLTHALAEDLPPAIVERVLVEDGGEAFSSERSRPPLTWRSRHDERSRAYGVRPLLGTVAPVQDTLLPTGPVLDQMTAGATLVEQSCCTGCGLVAAANTLLLEEHGDRAGTLFGLDTAEAVYMRGQRLDHVPGEDYPGTSVLGAMQAAVELGLFGGFLWCFGTRDIAQTIMRKRRAVVVGVPWSESMWETGPGGVVVLGGPDEGLGHCLTVNGITRKGPHGEPGPWFRWQQSAGESYGAGGFGWIHHAHLAALLRGIGEAAVPTLEPQAPTS